jgi:hypothetical protein
MSGYEADDSRSAGDCEETLQGIPLFRECHKSTASAGLV